MFRDNGTCWRVRTNQVARGGLGHQSVYTLVSEIDFRYNVFPQTGSFEHLKCTVHVVELGSVGVFERNEFGDA